MENRTGKVWTQDEIIVALCLYYKLASGTFSGTREQAIDGVASILGRSHASVEFKLSNLSACDDTSKITGLTNINKYDKIIFDKYFLHIDQLFKDGSNIIKNSSQSFDRSKNVLTEDNPYMEDNYDSSDKLNQTDANYSGEETIRLVKTREKQWAFRTKLLSTYEHRCCISGISQPELLIASHIIPWADNKEKRLDPSNGLLLNALLDRAFDKGLITFDATDLSLKISDRLKDAKSLDYLNQYRGAVLTKPRNERATPSKENLEYHNDIIFNKYVTESSEPTFFLYND